MNELVCPKCGHKFSVNDNDYASLVNQVKNSEFQKELNLRLEELHHQYEVEQKAEAKEMASRHQVELGQKNAEIVLLKAELQQNESRIKLAVMEEKQKAQSELQGKMSEIAELKAKAVADKAEAQNREKMLEDNYKQKLQMSEDQVAYYKDLKTKMSTKMVGETLEIHCSTLFNQLLRPVMPNAYFEKDNDASDGTKGDFIFRDSDNGTEYVSIMFEMKNEMDETATKHKNEDFFKKLDADRKKKGCEFAVLVSMLEPESELYNGGIVDVSYKYDKMYVIRPQFFIPIITLLVQTSKKSLEYKRELAIAQSKEVDITNFEAKIEDFKTKFGRHYELASSKFETAIAEIDKSITHLQKIKDALIGSKDNLRLAQKDTDELTIRKLTYKNPTMKAKFEEVNSATD